MLDDVVPLDEELAAALRAPGPRRSTLRTIVDVAGTGASAPASAP
ncbi:hypothetical protein J2Y69_000674 [Microbacterium resistens]|uniref:Uncharacterized protein n=1 Tax=Microbacterium resistens TaxID=156977 RepID=A0ABU1S8Z8_9MICO|nr:hypothetical protein [Microbacterium resistens]MDR6866089.1 hypothetical protein [Microbacterium resistens]